MSLRIGERSIWLKPSTRKEPSCCFAQIRLSMPNLRITTGVLCSMGSSTISPDGYGKAGRVGRSSYPGGSSSAPITHTARKIRASIKDSGTIKIHRKNTPEPSTRGSDGRFHKYLKRLKRGSLLQARSLQKHTRNG